MVASFKMIITALSAAVAACGMSATPAPVPLSAVEMCEDMNSWVDWTLATHPDVSWSSDPDMLRQRAEVSCREFDGAYDQRGAWFALSELNPTLNDAHAGLRLPDAAFEDWRSGGGSPFPVPVEVRASGVFVTEAGRNSQLMSGDRIVEINGRSTESLLSALLPRMRGETEALRRRVLSLKFAEALWTLTGDQGAHVVTVQRGDARIAGIRLDANQAAGTAPAPFELQFRDDIAILVVDTFSMHYLSEFDLFLTDAFESIADQGADTLIIDLRNNGGGARDLSDRLMIHLTSQRYTPISAVTARITPENQALVPGSELGQVISTPFAQWVQPPEALPHRFEGEAVILIGPGTYSQAVVFAATAQDFGVARLAGLPTEGAANQSGQVQRFVLPNSGLTVQSPIYIFTRASGEQGREPLRPDLEVQGQGEAQLAALIDRLSD